jgi:CDGSH-type Zn-finger protein
MARIVKRTWHEPLKLSIGGQDIHICRCGLSKNQPYCDGSHKLTTTEEEGKLYWYDGEGKRHECPDGFPGIRTF